MFRKKIKREIVAGTRRPRWRWLKIFSIAFLVLVVWQAFGWLTHTATPLRVAGTVSDNLYEQVYGEEIAKRAAALPKEINILVVGLDNRLGSNDNHADAIHLITIHTGDSVHATITSIPRGTPVKGYGIDEEFSFMANVRALKGRKALMKAVAKLARKKTIDYYAEVTFSQVMGVLELLGYKDPATALQFLRHRKSYALGDVQRSHNQGSFIRQQLIRRADMMTGAKGDLLIRMGIGMVDTDLDMETVQALVYLLKNANALDSAHITLDLLPHEYFSALEDVEIPDPDHIGSAVDKLVRRVGDEIDDLGRYDPYPHIKEMVDRAEKQSTPRALIAVIEPLYAQKGWLQIQERPRRQEIRDRVQDLLVKAYNDSKQPGKAAAVQQYMTEERKAFSDVESEHRTFSYGRRAGARHHDKPNPAASIRARHDDIPQEQTPVAPQDGQVQSEEVTVVPVETPKPEEPKVVDVDSSKHK